MGKEVSTQWIIRNADGKVTGPFSQEGIYQLIRQGGISGEEEIAKHPNGEWVPFATNSEFYDLLLSTMELRSVPIDEPAIEKMDAHTVINTQIKKNSGKGNSHLENTKIGDVSQITQFTQSFFSGVNKISDGLQKKLGLNTPSKSSSPSTSSSTSLSTGLPTIKQNQISSPQEVTRNLKLPVSPALNPTLRNDVKAYQGNYGDIPRPLPRPESKRLGPARLVLISLFIGLGAYFLEDLLNEGDPEHGGKIRLMAPRSGSSSSSGGVSIGDSLPKVKLAFERGNPSDWLGAQELLVSLAEANPTNTEVRELLCLTHKELWPFAYQDSEDLQVLTYMSQSTRALNPSERHGHTCEVIRSWLTGKFDEAKSQLEHLLQENPNVSFFIWLKAEVLLASNDYINGQGFASSLITAWPEFVRGRVLFAELSIKGNNYQEARTYLGQALSMNPEHKTTLLMLGDLDFRHFQQEETAYEILIQGVTSDELAPGILLGNAFADLAMIAQNRGDRSSARGFAEKGLAANPTNEMLKQLVEKLGGEVTGGDASARTQELVTLGDQYLRSGDCLAAQAQYRAAFDLNPKFPAAAVKAARCLYKINQHFHAYDYLKKAIKNNPTYFPAYTLLADYYSQKFDFTSAMAVLNQARVYSTEAYELYKGYGLVELRKNNFTGALGYVNKAIQIYGSDPESYTILARAQIGMGKAKEAFQSAQRAVELDSVNVEAKIAYGEAIAALQGEDAGLQYFGSLVTENQFVIDYKLAYAATLLKLERFNDVVSVYHDIIALDPKNKKARIGLGEALNGIAKTDEALREYLYAATLDPSDPEPISKAGLLYLDRGSYDPAMKQFQRVLLINPNYPLAHYYIGKAAFMNGNLNDALEEALAERRTNPGLVESYLLAADIYWVKENYTQCTAEYQQAVKIRSLGADLYVKLARCHRKAGALDVAQSMLNIAEEKESGYPEIYKEQGEVFKEMGDSVAANKAFEKYLALAPNAPDKKLIEQLMKGSNSR